MKRKWKLALAALLGFSAACSTVRNTPRKPSDAGTDEVRTEVRDSVRIRVMYGVPAPRPERIEREMKSDTTQRQQSDETPDAR